MSNYTNRLNDCIEQRLFNLAITNSVDFTQTIKEYNRRRTNIGIAYYHNLKGRPSHVLVKAYEGTKKYILDGGKNE